MDQSSLESVALIGVIHGIGEVVERSTIALIDHIYNQVSPGEKAGEVFVLFVVGGLQQISPIWAWCTKQVLSSLQTASCTCTNIITWWIVLH